MKLPVLFPELKGQRYDCQQCGRGCRELVVYLTERDRNKIDRQKWADKLEYLPYVLFGRSFVLNHKANGDCVFLREDNLCAIHAEFGFTEKPLSCQLFPFTLEPEGDGLRVSVRFDCPPIARNTGSALAKHRHDVVRIAGDLKAAAPKELAAPARPAELTAGRALSDDELDSLVRHLDGWVRNENLPIIDRLVGLKNLVDTLETAKLGNIRGKELDELVGMLTDDLPNVVESFDTRSLTPPTPKQLTLFRHAVFAHCENIRLEEASARLFKRFWYRLDQYKRARQLAGGTGSIPRLVRSHGGGAFEQLEQVRPHPELSVRDCDSLLTRYLRTRITGRTAFGGGYFGWPVLDGLRALLLAIAVTGWVTRYVALGDERGTFTYDDLVCAIGIVDRNATRSPELGLRPARLRLRYLWQDGGILRLLYTYPIPRSGSADDAE